MNFLAKLMKKIGQPFKVWLGPLLCIKILLETAQLLSKPFHPGLSLLIPFISFFIKAINFWNSSAKRSASCICFRHFLRFHKCFTSFYLSKNILINTFFYWNMCFLHDAKELSVSLWSTIISCDQKQNFSNLLSPIITKEFERLMSVCTCAIRVNIM